jgi:hypothetical protein
MARSVSGGAPPPSRAPEDPFKTASQKASLGPALERRSLCTPSGQKSTARQEPARTGRGPSPARCGRSRVLTVVRNSRRRARCVPDRPVNAGESRSLPDSPMHRLTCERAGRPAAQTDLLSNGSARNGRGIPGPRMGSGYAAWGAGASSFSPCCRLGVRGTCSPTQ